MYVRNSAADSIQLAKASTMALISMLVIIITVITQGVRVPGDLRGQLRGSLFVNDGIFQAIGVISFGNNPGHQYSIRANRCLAFVCRTSGTSHFSSLCYTDI